MRCLLVFALLVAVAYAQTHLEYDKLVSAEVKSILRNHHHMTVADCTSKCDAMFDPVDSQDEIYTDNMCKHFCDCEINSTCDHHNTKPPATTTAAPHGHHHG